MEQLDRMQSLQIYRSVCHYEVMCNHHNAVYTYRDALPCYEDWRLLTCKVEIFLVHECNIGRMPFLTPPVTHTDDSKTRIQVRHVKIQRLNPSPHKARVVET